MISSSCRWCVRGAPLARRGLRAAHSLYPRAARQTLYDLRTVVYTTYLAPSGAMQKWQRACAHHFLGSPVGPRRAEELLWHLERSEAWGAMRVVVRELDMFEMMWRTPRCGGGPARRCVERRPHARPLQVP